MEITSGQPNVTVGGNGMGGDWGIMFLAFLAMMGGGFGFGGRGPAPVTGDQAAASSAQLQNSMNFNDLQDQNRDINNNVNNVYHDLANNLGDKYNELQRDIAANAVTLADLRASQGQCCCEIKQQIAALNLENEKRFNALSSKMDQSEIQRLRDQVQDLKSDVRMQGVFRMPQGYTFNAGPGPFAAAPLPPTGFGFGA